MRGQGVRLVTMLPMAGQRALILRDCGLCVCRREEQPLHLKGGREQRINNNEVGQNLLYRTCNSNS